MSLLSRIAGIASAILPFTPAAAFAPLAAGIAQATAPRPATGGFAAQAGAIGGGVVAQVPRQLFPTQASFLPALPGVGAAAGAIGRAVGIGVAGVAVRGAASVARSAATYCRRHPQWCSTIGGTAAVAALINNGQLPPIKRRRSRGITARELRSFRRVAKVVKVYCPTVRRVPTRKRC